jgi:23S rRNA (pseudouridine1915-N3)-methyltransferase
MHWRIITVGRPGHSWVKEALGLYLKRVERYTRIEHTIVKEGPLQQVVQAIQAASEGALTVLLDERGKSLRSLDLARWVKTEEIGGRKRVCLIIGGANGHSDTLRDWADQTWTLSSFTLQHDMALIMMAEQLYRAYSILRGEPYHRE